MQLNINQKKIYNTDGWLKIKNLLSKKEIRDVKKQINLFLRENHHRFSGRDINYTGIKKNWKKINSFHKLHEFKYIRDYSKKKKILNLAKNLISKSKLKLRAAELFAKPFKNGLKSPAHQDNYYWCLKKPKALTIWIALEKSDRSNGGVFYYNGSHKLGLLKHVPSNSKGSSQKIESLKRLKRLKKIYPKLNVGDCLIHDSLVVHGSNRNTSKRSRKGITFQFIDYYSKIDKKRKTKYILSLKKQVGKRELN